MGHLIQQGTRTQIADGALRHAASSFLREEKGVSAVEFALLGPMLIFGLLAMVDLGLALTERMTIGHILRAGAQGATQDAGIASIDNVLRATAAKNMTVAKAGTIGDDTTLGLDVRRICSCAAQPTVAVACSTTCAGETPTQIFYVLSANKTYSGLFLPRLSQAKVLQVQVR